VGHESEVAHPNDYVRKKLGPQDVIMTRDWDGQVHLLLNRCAHRGNQVCEDERGNSGSFRCPYHGWTYRNTGELLGYPFNRGYGGKGTLERRLALGRVPRVDSYQGFVFGSFAFPSGDSRASRVQPVQLARRVTEVLGQRGAPGAPPTRSACAVSGGTTVPLRLEDPRSGPVRYLDALELETIVWLRDEHLARLLDPSADRWRDD